MKGSKKKILNWNLTLNSVLDSQYKLTLGLNTFNLLRGTQQTPVPRPHHWRRGNQEYAPLLRFQDLSFIYIYIKIWLVCLLVCLSVCLFVCLYPINVKTAKPIGPKFCVGPHMIPRKVYWKISIFFFKIEI